MTPQTTFATQYNPWKTHPEHRPRPCAIEPEPEVIEPVIVQVRAPRTSPEVWRVAVLAQIKLLGSASGTELVETMDAPKNAIYYALLGLRKEESIRIKLVPIKNRKPSYLYYPRLDDAQS